MLDTNVVSEPMRRAGDPVVTAWLDRQVAETLYFSQTSLAELLTGIAMLPEGRRKHGLEAKLGAVIETLFGARVLPFDGQAATTYATLVTRARAAGHAISVADAQIASIASLRGFAVATRDRGPFLAAGIRVIDPWTAGD